MQFYNTTLAGSLALSTLCLSSAVLAQAPVNDDCANAIPVSLGVNGPFSNVGATGAAGVFSCSSSAGNDIWFTYNSTCNGMVTVETCGADYDSTLAAYDGSAGCGGLTVVGCNDDTCGLASLVTFPATAGTTYYIQVGGWNLATGNFPLTLTCSYDFFVEAVAEATPGTGTLGQIGSTFASGDALRWNYNDVNSLFTGNFAVVGLNLGNGPQPVALTAGIPGFELAWAGSNPVGFAFTLPPAQIGAPDYSVNFPPNFFMIGDTVRLQGVVLDPVNAPGSVPVVATDNTVEFSYVPNCVATEDFEGTINGVGNYPTGWSDGGGTYQWTADSGGTPSGGTGPSVAHSGTQYMFCESSLPAALGETYIMDSPIYPAAQIPNGAITFQLSRVGSAIGTLEVFMDDGSNTFATSLATYSGSGTLEWDLELIQLPFVPANAQFRFVYTHGGNFTGDLAIDTFCTR